MQTPKFWHTPKPSLLAYALYPVALLYQKLYHHRVRTTKATRGNVPVLCIGNVSAGGAGKTPICIEMAKHLMVNGKKVVFLSRGYKGDLTGPVQVNPAKHTYRDVGDEPLLLAGVAPTIIAKKRDKGLALAAYLGADIVIMDDGMQNPTVYKDRSILVIDGKVGIGNGLTLPSGPLREPLAEALSRVHGVVIMGDDKHNVMDTILKIAPHMPVTFADLEAHCNGIYENQSVVAFAGIGRPSKFFETVHTLGYDTVQKIPYPDHHPYGESDIKSLRKLSTKHNAKLITTAKDKTRLPTEFHNEIYVVDIQVKWRMATAPKSLLGNLLG